MDGLVIRTLVAVLTAFSLAALAVARELGPPTPVSAPPRLRALAIRGSVFGILHTILFCQIAGWDFGIRMEIARDWLLVFQEVGLFYAVVGAMGMVWTRLHRGKTWETAATDPSRVSGHQLVTTGPYAMSRHPYYTSALFCFSGIQLALASWLVLSLVPFGLLAWHVAKSEELDLERLYGQAYRTYVQRVPMFLAIPPNPYSWHLYPLR